MFVASESARHIADISSSMLIKQFTAYWLSLYFMLLAGRRRNRNGLCSIKPKRLQWPLQLSSAWPRMRSTASACPPSTRSAPRRLRLLLGLSRWVSQVPLFPALDRTLRRYFLPLTGSCFVMLGLGGGVNYNFLYGVAWWMIPGICTGRLQHVLLVHGCNTSF